MTSALDFLQGVSKNAQEGFDKSQAILSFEEYLNEVLNRPRWHLRNCAQYFSGMLDSFGDYEIDCPTGKVRRFRVFDADFAGGEGRIFGQERIQETIVNYIRNFCKLGRVDKLLFLHGPNGSAKTSIIKALIKAAEAYSHKDEGALYQFSWIFPKKEVQSGSLGFGKSNTDAQEGFAKLSEQAIDAQLFCDQRDHPLLLLSVLDRQKFFEQVKTKHPNEHFDIADSLRIAELSNKNRQIYEALLSAYHGDLSAVLRHVRVERFYLSKRYRKGISVVEPQLSVDASVRQITSDQSILSLPIALRHLSLYEVAGPLVEANRGIIEYSDLLKRPIDVWKYLLVACEEAQVSVSSVSLAFDLLMVATSNELHLSSFREYPDWQSFKGRMELVRVPYLLRVSDEAGIYKHQIPKSLHDFHIAPHAIELAARFAVLTRLEPPNVQRYEQSLQEVILSLSPEEKLVLYDKGEVPSRLSQKEARHLRSKIKDIFSEYQTESNYEGRYGASPREIRVLLLSAAQNRNFDHLAVPAVFLQMEQLIEQKTSYEFLRREAVRGYRDPVFLLASVKKYYLEILEDEVRSAVGLYSHESYLDLFKRYVLHVSAWIKKERLFDPVLNRQIGPDEQFMAKTEKSFLAIEEASVDFRRQLISQIGAFKLEQPNNQLDYCILFSSHIRRLKEQIYSEQHEVVKRILRAYLALIENERSGHDDKDLAYAITLKEGLSKFGYNDLSARCAISFLLQQSKDASIYSSLQQHLNFR